MLKPCHVRAPVSTTTLVYIMKVGCSRTFYNSLVTRLFHLSNHHWIHKRLSTYLISNLSRLSFASTLTEISLSIRSIMFSSHVYKWTRYSDSISIFPSSWLHSNFLVASKENAFSLIRTHRFSPPEWERWDHKFCTAVPRGRLSLKVPPLRSSLLMSVILKKLFCGIPA